MQKLLQGSEAIFQQFQEGAEDVGWLQQQLLDFQVRSELTGTRGGDSEPDTSATSKVLEAETGEAEKRNDAFLFVLSASPCSPGPAGSLQYRTRPFLCTSLSHPGSSPPSGPVPRLSEQEAPTERSSRQGLPLASVPVCARLPADLHGGHAHLHRWVCTHCLTNQSHLAMNHVQISKTNEGRGSFANSCFIQDFSTHFNPKSGFF